MCCSPSQQAEEPGREQAELLHCTQGTVEILRVAVQVSGLCLLQRSGIYNLFSHPLHTHNWQVIICEQRKVFYYKCGHG